MSQSVHLYVDADACPVKAETVKVAERHGLPVVFVANAYLGVPRAPRVSTACRCQAPGGGAVPCIDSTMTPRRRISGAGVLMSTELVHRYDGHEAQRSLSVIRNEESCATAGCHPAPSQRPIGMRAGAGRRPQSPHCVP